MEKTERTSTADTLAAVPPASPAPAAEITLLDILNLAIEYRWLLVTMALGLATLFVTQALLTPRTYTATASFVAQGATGGGTGGLAGLAAQLGVQTGGGGNDSPAFYAELLESRGVLAAVADSAFPAESRGGGRAPLSRLLDTADPDPERQRALTVEALRGMIDVETSRETGIVHVTVTAPARALSAAIADRLIVQVNDFNLRQRQSRAGAERRFVEERLNLARAELRTAEDRLAAFLEGNRQYANSPSLTFRQGRLQQEVSMRQQAVSSMVLAFEQARIEEVRNLPRITVVESPVAPLRPNARGTVRKALVGFVLGAFLAFLVALGREYLGRSRTSDRDAAALLHALAGEAAADVRRPLSRVRSVLRI